MPIPKDRCHQALAYGTTLHTRCMFRRGHNGPHEGKGLKKFPYQRVRWFEGDSRQYVTDKDHEFSWTPRTKK